MYIVNADRQKQMLDRLIEVGAAENGWHTAYQLAESGQRFVRFFHHPESLGGGQPVLRTDPVPNNLAAWLHECFESPDRDDVVGLAWELSRAFEMWPAVLDWLETRSSVIGSDAARLFLTQLEILAPGNRRSILGKHLSEIDRDYAHFNALADRARRLLGDA